MREGENEGLNEVRAARLLIVGKCVGKVKRGLWDTLKLHPKQWGMERGRGGADLRGRGRRGEISLSLFKGPKSSSLPSSERELRAVQNINRPIPWSRSACPAH